MGTMTRRVCAAAWLPLSLVVLAVILHPVVDEALLAILLVIVALAATGLYDFLHTVRRKRRPPSGGGPGS